MVVLSDLQERAITEAISFVYEMGYSDHEALLIEAMCALPSIDTVMALAKKEKDLPKQTQFE